MKEVFIRDFNLPDELIKFIGKYKIYENDGHSGAKTLFIDKDAGYFIKIAEKGLLEKEQKMYRYYSSKGLSPQVITYISIEKDYLITKKLSGEDATEEKYLAHPNKLSTLYGEALRMLHEVDFTDCPLQNKSSELIKVIEKQYVKDQEPQIDYKKYIDTDDLEEIFRYICDNKHLIKNDALIHGDYCLPNIILKDFMFNGFIDLGSGGVGDRHFDLFWGLWSLKHNLKTDAYANRFLDAYGRDMIDDERLKLCGYIAAMSD